MTIEKPVNACHRCGATAYKPVITRDPEGNMRPNGQYQCVKCLLVFSSMSEWRGETPPQAQAATQPDKAPASPSADGETPAGQLPF